MATLILGGRRFEIVGQEISGGNADQRRALEALFPDPNQLPYVPSMDDAIAEHLAKQTGGDWEQGPVEGESDPEGTIY